jgi:dolichyl-phosphate-mannose-protein mannosyltransferase
MPFARGQQKWALAIGAVSATWAIFVLVFGGINVSILGLRIKSTDAFNPSVVALIAFLIFAYLRRRSRERTATHDAWSWREVGLLTAILTVAALVRFWALTFGLPHPAARPDEEAVAALAAGYYAGHFEQTIFTYPPLFILVVAATMWLVFYKVPSLLRRFNVELPVSDPSIAAERVIARVLSAASGVVSVWLLFRIGERLFGRTTGFIASAFLALAFLHVRDSHFGVTDIPMTCMVLAGFLAIVKLSESGSRSDLLVAGALTGLAVATKYNAALLVLPASLAILDDPRRRSLVIRLGHLVAFGVTMVVVFLIVCPYSVVNYDRFLVDLADISRHLAMGHGPDLGRGWSYHLTTTLRYGLGAPLLVAGILGLALMIGRDMRRGLLVALFPVAYYLLTGSGRTVFARYILPAVPFLCLTAAYLVTSATTAVITYVGREQWRIPATAMLAAIVVLPSTLSVITFDRLLTREDSRLIARRWIEERFPPGTTIMQIGPSNGRPYIDYENTYRLLDVTSTSRPTLVVVVSSPMGRHGLDPIKPWFEREYELRFTQAVVAEDNRANIYDMQDEFFVPLSGFAVERPGPNLQVYVRRQ